MTYVNNDIFESLRDAKPVSIELDTAEEVFFNTYDEMELDPENDPDFDTAKQDYYNDLTGLSAELTLEYENEKMEEYIYSLDITMEKFDYLMSKYVCW